MNKEQIPETRMTTTRTIKVRCSCCEGRGYRNATHFGVERAPCFCCHGTGTKTVHIDDGDE
jgi:DnaJ-class molecular chaperone